MIINSQSRKSAGISVTFLGGIWLKLGVEGDIINSFIMHSRAVNRAKVRWRFV